MKYFFTTCMVVLGAIVVIALRFECATSQNTIDRLNPPNQRDEHRGSRKERSRLHDTDPRIGNATPCGSVAPRPQPIPDRRPGNRGREYKITHFNPLTTGGNAELLRKENDPQDRRAHKAQSVVYRAPLRHHLRHYRHSRGVAAIAAKLVQTTVVHRADWNRMAASTLADSVITYPDRAARYSPPTALYWPPTCTLRRHHGRHARHTF